MSISLVLGQIGSGVCPEIRYFTILFSWENISLTLSLIGCLDMGDVEGGIYESVLPTVIDPKFDCPLLKRPVLKR